LIVCYNDNYRASWDTILGGYPEEHVLDNKDAWSGDHCMDPDFLSGVLLTNAPLQTDKPALEDIAPSIIKTFEVKVPEVMKGKNILA
jgi:bisphosphoglycerate-independent phosphoglycerate mutase (AlkP superfamily)